MKEFEPLSNRELEVAEQLVFGGTTKDVANSLYLSYDTVVTHKKNIYRKLKIKKETELSKWYFCTRFHIPINIKPIARTIMAVCMLMLLGGNMIVDNHSNMIRTARVRTTRVRTGRVRRSKD